MRRNEGFDVVVYYLIESLERCRSVRTTMRNPSVSEMRPWLPRLTHDEAHKVRCFGFRHMG